MVTLFSIGLIALGVVFAGIGFTGPVCPVHGDESLEYIAAGAVVIAIGTAVAFIGIFFGKEEKTVEVEISEEKGYAAHQEPIEKKDDKYFYNMLMEDDEAYEECVKNWQSRALTHILIKGEIFQIPDTVIEDVMSEREIVFPKRVGEF
jgi:hypothetical protein